jgi:hypothetical protein
MSARYEEGSKPSSDITNKFRLCRTERQVYFAVHFENMKEKRTTVDI